MIIYNVTVKVEPQIVEEWLSWLRNQHIPEIMNTGCFTDFKIVRLLELDDSEGPTYAIQYSAKGLEDYNRYINFHSSEFIKKSFDKWGEQFIAFRSVMEVVHHM